jgi:hypothetical protein
MTVSYVHRSHRAIAEKETEEMRTWALTFAASATLALGAQNAGAADAFNPGPARINAGTPITRGAHLAQPSFTPLAGLVLHQPRNYAEAALLAEIDRGLVARRVPDTLVHRFLVRLTAELS